MKKSLLILLMILGITAVAAGCGKHGEETEAQTDALAEAETLEIETETMQEDTSESTEIQTETEESETTEESSAGTTAAVITEKEARKLLIEEFGEVDEGSGDKNVFTYEEVVAVDGVAYYSYRWEAGDGTYLCNAFIRTDGTDALTGIYSDGKWELGSDFGSDDSDDSFDDDMEYDYDEEYDDWEDDSYDGGFGDVEEEGEEPAEDDEFEAYDTDDEVVVEP